MKEPKTGPRVHVAEQLIAKTWEELEALEHPTTGHLLFPDQILRRRPDGTVIKKKVMLRVPRESDLRKARVDARALAAAEGIDEDKDSELFQNLEVMCTLAVAIRNDTPPYEPWVPNPLELEANWDRGPLMQVWERLDDLTNLVDPRAQEITEEELLLLVMGIARSRNILPLRAFGSASQMSCIVSMATMLANFLDSTPSSVSSGSLTPGA